MSIKHICFDLDGTLVNSFPTINSCTLRTLRHFDITGTYEEKQFYNLIGHHFKDIFTELKISVPDLEKFIDIYKTYYFDYIHESVLYPGITDTLAFLKNNDIRISLLTTKGQDQAKNIIDHFGLSSYFDAVYGRRPGIPIKPSPEPLLTICNEIKISPTDTMMTGDSDLDIKCGKNAGTLTCAVLYGYRSTDVLKKESPDFMIKEFPEISNLVL